MGAGMTEAMWLGATAFATSALISYLIVRSVRWHLSFTADRPGPAPQKFHTEPVPRIGGVAIVAGMTATGLSAVLSAPDTTLYWMVMLSLVPAFLGGFIEDVTGRVGPGARLLLTVITAAFAFSLAGVHFERSHMAWLDRALAFAPFGYVALLFAVAGVAHAVNIIDGYNGLASGVALIVLMALGAVAQQSGDALLAAFCLGTGAATLGFVLQNYPHGRLFLGDSGAYVLGCSIAIASALLVLRNPAVSPWFPMALVVYPVWETLFSAVRRAVRSRKVSEPDARHLHSLVYRRVSRRWVRGRREQDRMLRNSLTALPFWITMACLAAAAVYSFDNTRIQQALIAGFIACYCIAYVRIGRFRTRRAAKVLAPDEALDSSDVG